MVGTAMAVMLATPVMPASARALATIEASHTLKVGLTGDYAPYSKRASDGTIRGADATMALALAKSLGVRLEIVPTTWTIAP
jgi:cyclohexadienyl dehydratase